MTTRLDARDAASAGERHAGVASEHGELHPECVDAAGDLALAQLAAGEPEAAVALLRELAERAQAKLGDESEATGIAFARLAETLRHCGAPEAEQLSCLTAAIKALSASVGPSHERTTEAFAQLAHVALNAQAVEVAVTAGMQALGGLQTRGEGESAAAGEVYATLAMAAAARQSPAHLPRRDRVGAVRVARVRRWLRSREPHRRRCRPALPGHARGRRGRRVRARRRGPPSATQRGRRCARRRRRAGRAGAQRALPVRLGREVQEVLRALSGQESVGEVVVSRRWFSRGCGRRAISKAMLVASARNCVAIHSRG